MLGFPPHPKVLLSPCQAATTGILSLGPPKSNFRLRNQNGLHLKTFPCFNYHHFCSYFSSLPSTLEYFSMQRSPLSTLCVFLPRSSSANALFRGKRNKKKFCKLSYILAQWPSSDQFSALDAIKTHLREQSTGDSTSYKVMGAKHSASKQLHVPISGYPYSAKQKASSQHSQLSCIPPHITTVPFSCHFNSRIRKLTAHLLSKELLVYREFSGIKVCSLGSAFVNDNF